MLGRHGVGAFWPLWPGGCGKQARMTQSRSDVIGSRNLTGGAADAWRRATLPARTGVSWRVARPEQDYAC